MKTMLEKIPVPVATNTIPLAALCFTLSSKRRRTSMVKRFLERLAFRCHSEPAKPTTRRGSASRSEQRERGSSFRAVEASLFVFRQGTASAVPDKSPN
jgi:hypothetical protein